MQKSDVPKYIHSNLVSLPTANITTQKVDEYKRDMIIYKLKRPGHILFVQFL